MNFSTKIQVIELQSRNEQGRNVLVSLGNGFQTINLFSIDNLPVKFNTISLSIKCRIYGFYYYQMSINQPHLYISNLQANH